MPLILCNHIALNCNTTCKNARVTMTENCIGFLLRLQIHEQLLPPTDNLFDRSCREKRRFTTVLWLQI